MVEQGRNKVELRSNSGRSKVEMRPNKVETKGRNKVEKGRHVKIRSNGGRKWAETRSNNEGGKKHCLANMDSDIEAFSRDPRDGCFAILAVQHAACIKYTNEAFPSC